MPVTWPLAPTVKPGDKITSKQMILLAKALNEKALDGRGDIIWRLLMYWYNLFRQMRNPDDSGLVFPAQGEFFELYQLLDPSSNQEWPVAGPGEAEGANLANPMNQFVYGSPGVSSEVNRLIFPEGIDVWIGAGPPVDPEDFWELGRAQRGVIEPVSGLQATPAAAAAQSFFQVVTPYYSPMGKAYGGYFPTPEVILDDCGESDGTGPIPDLQPFFTALDPGVDTSSFHPGSTDGGGISSVDGFPRVTYSGSCPFGTTLNTLGHVQGVVHLPFATYVFVSDGAGGIFVDRFDASQWTEGPYTGNGVLSRYDGGQLSRALWQFTMDFRGTPAQRDPDTYKIQDIAFDFQEFFTTQYALAPNIGVLSGDGVADVYPTATLSGATSFPAGEPLDFETGESASQHKYAEGFVLAGMFAKATGLVRETSIQVMDDGNVIASLTLTPDPDGNASTTLWLDQARADVVLSVQLGSEAVFSDGDGMITFQANELLDQKPQFWDAYLILRMMATNGGTEELSGVDGSGVDCARAKEIWDTYRENGCIVNQAAAGPRDQGDAITSNPVFEAARRLSREHVRVLNRRQFISYELGGDGKAVLKFKRYAYGLAEEKADCFYGIAPSYTPVTATVKGETYAVRAPAGGTIQYAGGNYSEGQQFTATTSEGIQAYGDGELYPVNGIRPDAFEKGWSNEWVMMLNTHVYNDSASSNWKPEAYGDYFTWNNRCHFHSGSAPAALRRFINYDYNTIVSPRDDGTGFDTQLLSETVQAEFVSPEAPSGMNYALGSNQTDEAHVNVSDDFYSSCQIYQAPYYVESATVEFVGTTEIVKITLSTRLRAHPTAVASFSDDPATWDAAALHTESYRTDDNSVREYALHTASGFDQCSFKTGDAGWGSDVETLDDFPAGSCLPHFFFVKLIEKPYEDGNDSQNPTDTRATIDALQHCEIMLKAGCEGFIDGTTSESITCATGVGVLYDFTFENLCFKAFHGRNIGAFRLSDRPDLPAGHGPSVNTVMVAEVFNRIALAVNELYRVRVDLPFEIQKRVTWLETYQIISADWPAPSPFNVCNTSDVWKVIWSGTPSDGATQFDFEDWTAVVGDSAAATCQSSIIAECTPIGQPDLNNLPQWFMYTFKQVVDFRVKVSNAALTHAVPAAWRGDIESIGGFMALWTDTRRRAVASSRPVGIEPAEGCGGTDDFFTDGSTQYYDLTEEVFLNTSICKMTDAGTLNPGPPSAGTYSSGNTGGIPDRSCGNKSENDLGMFLKTEPGFYVAVTLVPA